MKKKWFAAIGVAGIVALAVPTLAATTSEMLQPGDIKTIDCNGKTLRSSKIDANTMRLECLPFDRSSTTTTAAPTTTSSTVAPTTTTTAAPTTTTAATTTTVPSGATTPADVLDLTNWKITLPTPRSGSSQAREVLQPELANYEDQYFYDEGNTVVFTTPVGDATTSGSEYPRTELREMRNNGRDLAAWSSTSGTHIMTVRQAITQRPIVKPHIVAGQIHDGSDDVIQIRLEGTRLIIDCCDGSEVALLEPNYQLGTFFDLRIEVAAGRIKVFYNGIQKLDMAHVDSGNYFKAGSYPQSNPSRGDDPNTIGQVVISALTVSHT